MNDFKKRQAGFVALVSAIVISSLLIIIGATFGYAGFFARFNILDGEFKQTSQSLAIACAEIARLEIANNSAFMVPVGGKIYTVDSYGNTCKILSVTGSYTVQAQGIYQNSYSTVEETLSRTTSDVIVTSWKEIP